MAAVAPMPTFLPSGVRKSVEVYSPLIGVHSLISAVPTRRRFGEMHQS